MTDELKLPMAMSAEEEKALSERAAAFWRSIFSEPGHEEFKAAMRAVFEPRTVMQFDRKATPGGAGAFEISPGFGCGENLESEKFIKEKGYATEEIILKCRAICDLIDREPNGRHINHLVIINHDPQGHYAHIRRPSNGLYLVFPALLDEAAGLLELLLLPHESYHAALSESDPAAEEVLVHALSFVRAANVYRDEKRGARPRGLFESGICHLQRLFSEVEGGREGRMTQSLAIRKLIDSMELFEKNNGRPADGEELLETALPLALKLLRDNVKLLVDCVAEGLGRAEDTAVLDEARALWAARKEALLSGAPLY